MQTIKLCSHVGADGILHLTALPAAMRYILKAESYARKRARRKLYCIIAGSAVVFPRG
jgi:hypothetical protein